MRNKEGKQEDRFSPRKTPLGKVFSALVSLFRTIRGIKVRSVTRREEFLVVRTSEGASKADGEADRVTRATGVNVSPGKRAVRGACKQSTHIGGKWTHAYRLKPRRRVGVGGTDRVKGSTGPVCAAVCICAHAALFIRAVNQGRYDIVPRNGTRKERARKEAGGEGRAGPARFGTSPAVTPRVTRKLFNLRRTSDLRARARAYSGRLCVYMHAYMCEARE